jgi:TRAP-type C4-dicarboxylate transport system permease small subunit
MYALGAVSDIAHIPTWIPHSAIAISFTAIALIVLVRGLQRITRTDARSADNALERGL